MINTQKEEKRRRCNGGRRKKDVDGGHQAKALTGSDVVALTVRSDKLIHYLFREKAEPRTL